MPTIHLTPLQRATEYARRARAVDRGPLTQPKNWKKATPKPPSRAVNPNEPRLVAPGPDLSYYPNPVAPPAPAAPAPVVVPGLGVVEAPVARKRARTLLTG